MLECHETRRQLRTTLRRGTARGTFLKLAVPESLAVLRRSGLDFVVVDLEHSMLSESQAVELLRAAVGCGLPALVRIPQVDAGLVNRLLEAGAAGIQLSMLSTTAQRADLVAATRFAPAGRRSISLANPAAGFGAVPPHQYVALDAVDPPILVGQIETVSTDDLHGVLAGLDVCFVGTTDLSVDLGDDGGPDRLVAAVERIRRAAASSGVVFGGWAASPAAVDDVGLTDARYLILSSDLQLLMGGLRGLAASE